jgi:hypothetical protein
MYGVLFQLSSQGGGTISSGNSVGGASTYITMSGPAYYSSTSGVAGTFAVAGQSNMSSGTATFNTLTVSPTINNSGTYSGIFRGLYYNPTLTSLTGTTHRAIETTSGDVLFAGNGPKLIFQETTAALNTPSTTSIFFGASTTPGYGAGIFAVGGAGYNRANIVIASGGATDISNVTTANANFVASPGGTDIYKNTTINASNLTFRTATLNSGTLSMYWSHAETKVGLFSNSLGSYGRGDFRIALSNTFDSTTVSAADTRFMVTGDTYNVLIGTTTDSGYKLDVNGSARVGSLGLYGNNGTITAPLIKFNGSNKVNVDPQGYGTVTNDSLITGNYILASGGGIRANGGFGAKGGNSVISTPFISYGISRPDNDASVNALAGMGGVHDGATFWFQGLGLVFYTSNGPDISGGSYLSEKMRLSSGGNLLVGTTTDSARLTVKGSGSTSATNALLVQNSGGTESFKIQDDNIVRTTYLGVGGGTSTNNIGGTTIAQFGNAVSSGDQLIVVDSVAGTKRGFKFGNQGTIRMALIQDGVNLQIGNFVSTFNPYVTFEYVTGNVGFGTASTNASAKVQIDSTTQGFLAPRMTTAEINAITTPAEGLQVYNTDLHVICFYDGTAWKKVSHSNM